MGSATKAKDTAGGSSQGIAFQDAVRRFLDYLVSERAYSARTVEAYRIDLLGSDRGPTPGRDAAASLALYLLEATGVGSVAIGEVTQREVRGFIAWLHRKRLGRRTVARKLAAVKSLFRFCLARGLVEANPSRLVQTPKLEKRLPTLLSAAEARTLMELPDRATPAGARDAAILELLYSSGLRRTELATLRIGDIDLNGSTARVMGKGARERIVPFGRPAREALQSWLRVRSSLARPDAGDRLFVGNRGAALDGAGVYRIVRRHMSRVTDQKKRSPHVLRHTFATHMLDAGAGLREVGELLGHASLSSTQVYTHVTVERLKEAYGRAHPRADDQQNETDPHL